MVRRYYEDLCVYLHLKDERQTAVRISSGDSFHKAGAAKLRPKCFLLCVREHCLFKLPSTSCQVYCIWLCRCRGIIEVYNIL